MDCRTLLPRFSSCFRTPFRAALASGVLKSPSRYSSIALVSVGFSVKINSWILSFCSNFSVRTGLSVTTGSLPSTSPESSEATGPVAWESPLCSHSVKRFPNSFA